MVEAANRGPGGAGLSNTTYVTPQELRIQGERVQSTCMVNNLNFEFSLVVVLDDFSDPSLISNGADL